MAKPEGRIDMAERHVREAEAHISEQYARIERLHGLSLPTGEAETFLTQLKEGLRSHQRDLDELYRQRSAGLRTQSGELSFDGPTHAHSAHDGRNEPPRR